MKACDRHGRSEGSLKVGRFVMEVHDLEEVVETPMGPVPKKVFEQEFCKVCFESFVAWSKTKPESLYLIEEDPAKQAAKGAK